LKLLTDNFNLSFVEAGPAEKPASTGQEAGPTSFGCKRLDEGGVFRRSDALCDGGGQTGKIALPERRRIEP
jgi:hypothetical protein